MVIHTHTSTVGRVFFFLPFANTIRLTVSYHLLIAPIRANIDSELALPFLYSRVRCCNGTNALGSQYDVVDPEQVALYAAVDSSSLPMEQNGVLYP